MSITGERPVAGSVAGSGPGSAAAGDPQSGVSESEVVGKQWSKRVNVAKLWAVGMGNPAVRRAFWQLAYGTDAREFVYQWERLADEPPGTRVLDVPSGAGVFLLGLTPESQLEYTAVDISGEMVARVRAAAAEAGLTNVTALSADATRLPMPDGSFDLVLTFNGLHCFNEPWAALAEFRRVLARDGRIRGTILIKRPGVVAPRAQHYFQFRKLLGPIGTWAQVQTWFAAAGLSVERVRQNGALAFFEGKAV
jgi:SAM-dependent methyltransferase